MQSEANLKDLETLQKIFSKHKGKLGQKVLLDSKAAWNLLLQMYNRAMPHVSFLDYFWSWRGLFGGLFSILVEPLPKAGIYHSLCTGYAGLLLARAKLETGAPCVITEHGIYTNERRLEIANADWLHDPEDFSLSVNSERRELKDFWIDTFNNYSKLCYEACDQIVTLYEGNQQFQINDGADPAKLKVIPNGIDFLKFNAVQRRPHPPTVALIGRVVPIKDVKSYIKAVRILKDKIPDLQALMLGPADEDPEYAKECERMSECLGLQETFRFEGKVSIEEYLGAIDVIVLTSLSEAQPLVILEAGAAGIPTVATDVGACREMIMGMRSENPSLGQGGDVVPLSDPEAVASAIYNLLMDQTHYSGCSSAIVQRVRTYYDKPLQHKAYKELYDCLSKKKGEPLGRGGEELTRKAA